MIKITKNERDYLVNVCKINMGEGGISKTHSHHPRYYLTESEQNLRALLEFSPHNDEAQAILDKIDVRKRRYNKRKHN